MSEVKLNKYEVLNDLLLLQWGDGSENALPLKSLRDNCPCANCAGETDVFGNIYKGPPQIMNEKSYRIKGFNQLDIMLSDRFGKTDTAMVYILMNI